MSAHREEAGARSDPQRGATFRLNIGYLGFAAMLLWIGSIGSQWQPTTFHGALSTEDLSWVLVGLACATCAIISLRRRSCRLPRHVIGVGDVLSTVLMISCSADATWHAGWPRSVEYFALFVGCIAAAWALMRWGALLSQMGTRSLVRVMVANTCVVFVCKVIVGWGDALLGSAALTGALLTCPALSLAGLQACRNAAHDSGTRVYNRTALKSLHGVALFVLLFSVVLRLLDMLTLQTRSSSLSDAIAFCVLLFLVAWVFVLSRTIDFYQNVKALLVVTALGSFAYAVTGGIAQSAAFGLLWGIRELTRFYLFLLMADISFHSDESPVVFFGLGWAFCGISRLPFCFVSEQAFARASFADGGYVSLALALILLLLFGIMAFAFYELPAGLRPPLADVRPYQLRGERGEGGLESFCSSLAKQYGLTAREIQIAQYACGGRSKSYIAETLFISENTVKFHLRNLYRKLGIRSKQELIDLYEYAMRRGASARRGRS